MSTHPGAPRFARRESERPRRDFVNQARTDPALRPEETTLNGWLWLAPGATSYRKVEFTPLAVLLQGVAPKFLGKFGKISQEKAGN